MHSLLWCVAGADLMDPDIRAALFEDVDDEGQPFEELADDFVLEALQAPAQPDFDFDAHIARLIAQRLFEYQHHILTFMLLSW